MRLLENQLQKFQLYFASEKGTAESISEEIEERCNDHGLVCIRSCISSLQNIENLGSCTVFVGSTTGDGEPPETALKIMQMLKNKASSGEEVEPFTYTVLGLGDTNYTNFCNFGKTLDKYLSTIGGKRFYECGWADDGVGLEIVVEPWISHLFTALKSNIKMVSSPALNVEPLDIVNGDLLESDNRTKTLDIRPENELEIVRQLFSKDTVKFSDLENHPVRVCGLDGTSKLTLPAKPVPYLSVSLQEEHCETVPQNVYPSAASDIFHSQIISARQLTKLGSHKETLEIALSLGKESSLDYEPGDSFGIVTPNSRKEVDMFLSRLFLLQKQDWCCNISVLTGTKKRNACIPAHLPPKCSLRELITRCIDLRAVPKKTFLRALLEYAGDELQRRRLSEFVSKEGTKEYNDHVRLKGVGFLDFLMLFPSLNPPLSVVLEHSSKIAPRPYSATSSPLAHPNELRFVFNLISVQRGTHLAYDRKGLCTGYLKKTAKSKLSKDLADLVHSIDIEDNDVQLYLRASKTFRLPADSTRPLIMVGPGTGVAPFLGFLHHRKAQLSSDPQKNFGDSYLFFGCRNRKRDFLFEKDLSDFVKDGILTKLLVSFSRDTDEEGKENAPKYVQDNLKRHGSTLCELIFEQNAAVYVCGDAKNMAKDVFEAFVLVITENLHCDEATARSKLASMQLDGRYLQDVWS